MHMKDTVSTLLIVASAAVLLLLGVVHLLYTFRGPNLQPRDPELTARMMAVSPGISRETTMWKAWVGFNVSHTFGLLLFAAIYGYLAMRHSGFLFQSWFLLTAGFALLVGYAVLARIYWFSAPLRGVGFAALLYIAGIVINRA
jgi:hypothetical protein